LPPVVERDGDFTVPFDAGHRVNGDGFGHI
jgi:hypothetical protein